MKTILFFFSLFTSIAAIAQTTVQITPVSATYTATPTIQFKVSWLNSSRTGTHNSKVWVFIDYRAVTDNAPSGNWARALISGTPTATPGTPTREATTDKGFWLQGTSGSSGTYNGTVTVTLSSVPAKFNWCAYVSDYPPNVTATNGTYIFKGTPPFALIAAGGTIQMVNGTTLAASALDITPVAIRDKTECPNVFCPYTGSDLYSDDTHLCRQRTAGAKNWEAWIKDTRDNNLYRIVKMPDNKWYMGQNLNYRGVTYYCYGSTANCNATNGVWYRYANVSAGLCPSGWLMPNNSQWRAFITDNNLTFRNTRAQTKSGDDTYGLTVQVCGAHGTASQGWYSDWEMWYSSSFDAQYIQFGLTDLPVAFGYWHVDYRYYPDDAGNIRCFRQL